MKQENKGVKLTSEKLWEFGENVHKIRKLTESSLKTYDELVVSIQMQYLCKEGLPKRSDMKDQYVGEKKQPCIVITNEDGKEFTYPMEDVPHEVRAFVLNRYDDARWQSERYKVAKYKKLGWLKPYPDYDKKEGDETDGEETLDSQVHA